jgi:hypothetical protein
MQIAQTHWLTGSAQSFYEWRKASAFWNELQRYVHCDHGKSSKDRNYQKSKYKTPCTSLFKTDGTYSDSIFSKVQTTFGTSDNCHEKITPFFSMTTHII